MTEHSADTVEASLREWLSKQPDIEWLGECYQPRFIMDALSVYKAALRAIADTPKEGE